MHKRTWKSLVNFNGVGQISLSTATFSEVSTDKKCMRIRLQYENVDVP